MKTVFKSLPFVAAIGTLFFFSSCSKNHGDINALLTLPNGVIRTGDMPGPSGSNAPVINTLNHNDNFIAGGGCPMQLSCTTQGSFTLAKLYLGAEDYSGYYELAISGSTIIINPIIAQNVDLNELVIKVAVEDNGGNVSTVSSFTVTRIEVGTGILQVSLTFDKATDLDLYLVEPDGEVIYYGNRNSSNGGILDLDSNPACSTDNVNNENITYDDQATIEDGTYTVRVNNYADCVGQTVNYTVVARYNNEIISTSGNANPFNGSFAAGTDTPGGSDAGQVIFTFDIMTQRNGTRTLAPAVASFK